MILRTSSNRLLLFTFDRTTRLLVYLWRLMRNVTRKASRSCAPLAIVRRCRLVGNRVNRWKLVRLSGLILMTVIRILLVFVSRRVRVVPACVIVRAIGSVTIIGHRTRFGRRVTIRARWLRWLVRGRMTLKLFRLLSRLVRVRSVIGLRPRTCW